MYNSFLGQFFHNVNLVQIPITDMRDQDRLTDTGAPEPYKQGGETAKESVTNSIN